MTTEAQKGEGGNVHTHMRRHGPGSPDPGHALRPDGVTDAMAEVPLARPAPTARPHVAGPPVRKGAPLGQRRPARRQPGPDRPDGLRAQARPLPTAGRRRLQGDRGRVPLGQPDRLRLPAADHRRGPRPRRRRDPGAHAMPPGADRAHLRVARRARPGPASTSTTRSPNCNEGSSSGSTRRASSTSPSRPPSCASNTSAT